MPVYPPEVLFINGNCYRVISNGDCGAPDDVEPYAFGPLTAFAYVFATAPRWPFDGEAEEDCDDDGFQYCPF